MEFIFIFAVVASIVWIVWRMRTKVRASKNVALEKAWRVVLSDPNYVHRRIYEERKREYDAQARKESEDA